MNEQPTYQTGQPMQITPKGVALARTVDSTLSSSSEIVLNNQTTFIRCYAVAQDVYLRWGIENCNELTFDEVIPAGQIVDLAVPVDGAGTKFGYLNVIERVAGATIIIIEK